MTDLIGVLVDPPLLGSRWMKEGGRAVIETPSGSRPPMGPGESSGCVRGHRGVESGGQEYSVIV
eukprot:2386835-Rhodomonas_salina.1